MTNTKIFRKLHQRLLLLPLLLLSFAAAAQVSVTGKVLDAENDEPLVGVNILVKGKVIGTTTDLDGEFRLNVNSVAPPITLVITSVGFAPQEILISQSSANIEVKLEPQVMLGQEIVVSASRIEENILESPVTIEKMGVLEIQNTPADDYYKSIQNLKGVDMTSSSINFQIVNARGFNSTGNTRFVQMTDGMDTQAPALNFPVGNLNGPTELDVESVELIPGAASALYGPNAFNGILLVTSKNPFEYQGFSAMYKFGMNHFGNQDVSNEFLTVDAPDSPQPMHTAAIRYAKAFNNKFAFKVNASYSQATDWYGSTLTDQNPERQGDLGVNPGANFVHAFGEDVSTSLPLVGLQLGGSLPAPLLPYLAAGDLPNNIISRTAIPEQFLVDYGAENIKINTGLHYRLTDNLEASYTFNGGYGTSIYTGAQRYSLKNFGVTQHKLELESNKFFIRGYITQENSGDSYIADKIAADISNDAISHSAWFGTYAAAYLTGLAQAGVTPGTASQLPADVRTQLHQAARAAADAPLFENGGEAFENSKEIFQNLTIPEGAKFDDQSLFYHAEGQYDFSEDLSFMDLQVGASYRLYDLQSNGTIFADTTGNDITIQEYGMYAQASKRFFDDFLKLTGSVRYDKNENFDGQINPRLSSVLKLSDRTNFRASYQTGFRLPTTQGQHISLDVGTFRILGGLPQYAASFNAYENAYTVASVLEYTAAVSAAGTSAAVVDPANLALLQPVPEGGYDPVKPEQVQSFEFGLKGLLSDKISYDVVYYNNTYTDFITQVSIRKAAGDINVNGINAQGLLVGTGANTYQIYTNSDEEIRAHGFALGTEYALPGNYMFRLNYNWNKQIDQLSEEFLNDFNTPEHKFNLLLGNRKLTDRLGASVSYRWQDAFRWESSFAQGDVPSYSTVDAQISYRVPSIKSLVKLGGSNVFNNQYYQNFGGPTIGAIYYVSITFDQFMN